MLTRKYQWPNGQLPPPAAAQPSHIPPDVQVCLQQDDEGSFIPTNHIQPTIPVSAAGLRES